MKRIRLLRLVFLLAILSVLISSIVVSSIWIHQSYLDMKKTTRLAEKLYIQDKKNLLKEEVNNVVGLIDSQRKTQESMFKRKLLSRAHKIYYIAYHVFNIHRREYPVEKIKSLIVNILINLPFVEPHGSVIITDKNGRVIYASDDAYKNRVFPIGFFKEGYTDLRFDSHRIVAYLKYFEPFDWYVGYAQDAFYFENYLRSNIKWQLSRLRYGPNKHGYFFAAKLLNINGGSCFAISIVNPNRESLVGKCLSDNVTDKFGRYFRKEYLASLRKRGYAFLEYAYKIPGTNKEGRKLSYMVIYKPFNWIIGSGFYVEDISTSFSNTMKRLFRRDLLHRIWICVFATFLVMLLIFVAYLLLYSLLKRDIKRLDEFFENYPHKRRVDAEDMRIRELYRLAKNVNNMAERIDCYESQLQTVVNRYQNLARYMPDCVIIFRKTGRGIVIDDINSCVSECLSMSPEKIVGGKLEEILAGMPEVVENVKLVFETGRTVTGTQPVENCASRGERHFSYTIYRLKEDEVVFVAKDTTDTIRLLEHLRSERERLESFINAINAGIIVTSPKGDLFFMNEAARKIFEMPEDVEPTKEMFVAMLGEKGYKEVMGFIKNAPEQGISRHNIPIKLKGNTVKWLDVSIGRLNMDDNSMIVVSFFDITSRYLKEKEIEYLSFHDYLTDLFNRMYFEEELKRLFSKRSYPLALVLCDVNGLKIVNDELGHKWGDLLLKKVAEILSESSRSSDVVARIGGDEFAVIMPNTSREGVEAFLRRVKEKIDASNRQGKLYLSVSFGYAVQYGEFETIEDLFSAADANMYENKYSSYRQEELMHVLEAARLLKGVEGEDEEPDPYRMR